MSDHEREQTEDHEAGDEAAERPAQGAALHTGDGSKGESTPQDATDDTRWDTDQHSDAPGPTGTG